EEYDRYSELAGKESHARLSELVTSPEWEALDYEGKTKAAKKIVDQAREDARDRLFDGASADPWSSFPDAGGNAPAANDPWSDFEDVPQRDVIGSLQNAIPGVRFTSGFRTPEYQEDMRRRGYNPASNSAHLDGS